MGSQQRQRGAADHVRVRKVESLFGLKLDLNNTEWHNLFRAKEFWDKWKTNNLWIGLNGH